MNIKDTIVPFGENIPTRSVDSVLPALYRNIIKDLGIEEGRFLVNIDKYVRKTIEPENFKEVSSIRGNLRKELLRSVMTWKVFIRGLKVINIRQFVFTVKAEVTRKPWEDGSTEAYVAYRIVLDEKIKIEDSKVITDTDSVLASAFREIMFIMGVTPQKFMMLIADYIVKANVPTNMREVSSTRGNLKKELFKKAITWKVFVKGLSFLHVRRFIITIGLHHWNGKITEHSFPVTIDDLHGDTDD